MECFRLLFDHLGWIEHQFLSGIRDSRKAGSLCGMLRGVGGVRKSIHQSWLAKWLGLGLLCWGFKGVKGEILSEEASTLQIRSVAFPPGQCASLQLQPCHRLFDQDGHQDSSSPSLPFRRCSLWLWLFPKLRVCRYETFEESRTIYIYIHIYDEAYICVCVCVFVYIYIYILIHYWAVKWWEAIKSKRGKSKFT